MQRLVNRFSKLNKNVFGIKESQRVRTVVASHQFQSHFMITEDFIGKGHEAITRSEDTHHIRVFIHFKCM